MSTAIDGNPQAWIQRTRFCLTGTCCPDRIWQNHQPIRSCKLSVNVFDSKSLGEPTAIPN
jgi:hypothetical protein